MKKGTNWRVTSDYIGAGRLLLGPQSLVVGTDYGVQCVPRPQGTATGWKAKLGSRCLGLLAHEGAIIAACREGLFALSPEGEERWGTHSFKAVVHEPVAFQKGVLLTTQSAIHFLREWNGSEWRFDFSEVLGKSVKEVRVINIFELDTNIVAGVVDYDSGIGSVIVLSGKNGKKMWASEAGPLSELFPAGRGTFVWCQTGYGKFETRLSRLDGHELWRQDYAGVGCVRQDGSLAMVVGSNESPEWDDWEYRQIAPSGKVEVAIRGKGRSAVRPHCRRDGTVYFVGSVLPLDPSGSRADYTSFLHMPQEVRFQHLLGIRPQLPIYEVYLLRARPGSPTLDVLNYVQGSFSFAGLEFAGEEVILCDGRDIVAVTG
jgi:hypothetical protein